MPDIPFIAYWANQISIWMSTPWLFIPILLMLAPLFFGIAWWLKDSYDKREIRRLRRALREREAQLKFAQDLQEVATAKADALKAELSEIRDKVQHTYEHADVVPSELPTMIEAASTTAIQLTTANSSVHQALNLRPVTVSREGRMRVELQGRVSESGPQ
jgi:Tfp pilus assembly protein PilO